MTLPHGESMAMTAATDMVNHPPHYSWMDPAYEPIKVIQAWRLGFCLGNTVKYIARAEEKGAPIEDLRKAAWYLQCEIDRRVAESELDTVGPSR